MADLMGNIINADFYHSEDVCTIAGQLVGKVLVSVKDGYRTSGRIVETEAYKAPEDKASHAFNYRRTLRTQTMYMGGGYSYVYLCYGIHRLFNIITGPVDCPHAVLIRAIEPMEGIDIMLARRNLAYFKKGFTSGPGILTQALNIQMEDNGQPVWKSNSKVFVEDDNYNIPDNFIIASPRVGVESSGIWAKKHWRYTLKNSKWISKPI